MGRVPRAAVILLKDSIGVRLVDLSPKVLQRPIWLLWCFIHILWLIGFRNRFLVMIEWAWAYFRFERSARLITREPRPSAASPARA